MVKSNLDYYVLVTLGELHQINKKDTIRIFVASRDTDGTFSSEQLSIISQYGVYGLDEGHPVVIAQAQ